MGILSKVAKFELGDKDDVRTLRRKQKAKAIIKLASRIWKFFKETKQGIQIPIMEGGGMLQEDQG